MGGNLFNTFVHQKQYKNSNIFISQWLNEEWGSGQTLPVLTECTICQLSTVQVRSFWSASSSCLTSCDPPRPSPPPTAHVGGVEPVDPAPASSLGSPLPGRTDQRRYWKTSSFLVWQLTAKWHYSSAFTALNRFRFKPVIGYGYKFVSLMSIVLAGVRVEYNENGIKIDLVSQCSLCIRIIVANPVTYLNNWQGFEFNSRWAILDSKSEYSTVLRCRSR